MHVTVAPAALVSPLFLERDSPGRPFMGPDPRAEALAVLWMRACARATALDSSREPDGFAAETRRGNVVIVRHGDRLAAALSTPATPVTAVRYDLVRALER